MPSTDFDKQSYWHTRFTTETSFEWLISSETFMSVLEPQILSQYSPTTSLLHIGCGTSDLHIHLRRSGFTNVLNIDFEPLATEHANRLEQEVFGDVKMRYAVADATLLTDVLREKFDLVVDKSTIDAVACGGEDATRRMVKEVEKCLSPGGMWVSLSYSASRFELDGLPFECEVLAKFPIEKQRATDPDLFYWSYSLRSSCTKD